MRTTTIRKLSILGASLALPISAIAQTCCPSGGNGANVQSISALAAPQANCCPSGGNGAQMTGLGQSTPNAVDLSSSPMWRVYVFQLNGVRYFQVNDSAAHVRAAVAATNGVVLQLPVGPDVVQQVTDIPAGVPAIYQDAFVAIVPMPQPDGTVQWLVQSKL